jgi:ABC-type transport system involved in cytochrome c biogenesis permease component
MPEDAERIAKPTLSSLVRGIVDDAKQLVIGQYELRKYQTLHQIAKAKAMAIWAGVGIAFAVIGTILIILMVVHLLHEILNLPLWGSYGIVGFVLVVAAGACLYVAKTRR